VAELIFELPPDYLKSRAPTIGRLERAGMVGGLERVRDILHAALARGPASTHRSVLAKAVALHGLCRRSRRRVGRGAWETKDAFEYPTFRTSLAADEP